MTTLTVDLAAAGTSAGIGDSPASTPLATRTADAETTVDRTGAPPEAAASGLSDRTSEPAPAPERPAEPARDEPTVDPDLAIEDYLRDPTAADAIARLRAAGPEALTRIAARFPGPIDPRAQGDARSFPPPSAHGPLLRACIELGGAITPHILDLVDHPRPQIRFYAAFLFQELRDPRSLRPLAAHAFDPDPDVRLIATRVLESYSRAPGFVEATEVVRAALRARDRERVLLATEAAGTLRDTHAVPILIDLLSLRDKQVRETALESLCSITAKHHGYRPAKWKAWYAENGQQSRLEWVIDALHHRDAAVRRWASDELVRITGHRIPAPPEGEKGGARYVLAQWQAWVSAHGADRS
jgi:HEAT repeat protein